MRKLFFIVVLVLQAAFTHVVYSDEVLGYQDTIYGGYDVGISYRSSMENYALVLYDFYTDEISYYVLTNKRPFEWNELSLDVISIDPDIVLSCYNGEPDNPNYHYHIFDVDNRKLIDSLEVDAELIENSIDESCFYLHHYDKYIEKISLDKDFRIKKSERIGSKCQSVIWGYDNEGLFVIKDQHEFFIYSKYDYSLLYRISDFCVSSIYFSKESDYPVLKSRNNQYYLLTTNEVEEVTKKIPELMYETNFLNKYIHRIETDDNLYFYAKNEKPFLILDDSLDAYIIGDHEKFNNYRLEIGATHKINTQEIRLAIWDEYPRVTKHFPSDYNLYSIDIISLEYQDITIDEFLGTSSHFYIFRQNEDVFFYPEELEKFNKKKNK